MSTPHNSAQKGQIAKTVLMPGDPLRAKFIAETFLENASEFNHVRGMLGYTGSYKGKPVSVMGSGMGIPSIGIYSYELFTHYDVEQIIRIGSCGGYDENLQLFDVILVKDSFSESTYAKIQGGFEGDIIPASDELLQKLRQSAQALNTPLVEGRIHSGDVFYHGPIPEGAEPSWKKLFREKGCLAAEMESFGLFHNARMTGKKAACLLTVSDSLANHQETTTEEREKGFTQMMEIALGAV